MVNFETEQKYTVNLPQGTADVRKAGMVPHSRFGRLNTRTALRWPAAGLEQDDCAPVNQLIMVGSGLVVFRGGESPGMPRPLIW